MQHKDDDKNKNNNTPPQPDWQKWIIPGLVILAVLWLFQVFGGFGSMDLQNNVEINYTTLYDQAQQNNVAEISIQGNKATGRFRTTISTPNGNAEYFSVVLLPNNDRLIDALITADTDIKSQSTETSTLVAFAINFLPILLIIGLLVWMARRAQRQMNGAMSFGRTQAREYNVERPQITFDDVAGQKSAKDELVEIVDFLKEPDKYIALGARIPRGVLLIGPPGTGKTLLARAVAGEASVSFFSIAASEFVEMFVGVGASRVRDLFKRAKDNAPSIVFIDEIDAVGRQRGAGLGGGNDEREQTLNQMLAEMDGFDQNESVIVMAATNRNDVLDPALLRPGRFDRQVTVGLPDRAGRLAILKIHTRGKPLDSKVDLDQIARGTIGFSGADLANIANEAALSAARHNAKKITTRDFSDAFDRIVLGTERPPLSDPHERKVVAYHEAGHALVATLIPEADPVLKVTIVPRGQALGVTASMPTDDRRNYSKKYLEVRMMMLLGGRAAEQIIFDEVTTGAENDLRRVTDLARRMVAQFGMSEAIGQLNFGDDDRQPFLGYSISQNKSYSEETAAKIDVEVRKIIDQAYSDTLILIQNNEDKLRTLAQALLEHEVVEQAHMLSLWGMDINSEDQTDANILKQEAISSHFALSPKEAVEEEEKEDIHVASSENEEPALELDDETPPQQNL